MADTPMPAAELMAKADYELDGPPMSWERFKELYPESARRRIHGKRAALRAIAEMEPTNSMKSAAKEADSWGDRLCDNPGIQVARAVILAAANEGEKK